MAQVAIAEQPKQLAIGGALYHIGPQARLAIRALKIRAVAAGAVIGKEPSPGCNRIGLPCIGVGSGSLLGGHALQPVLTDFGTQKSHVPEQQQHNWHRFAHRYRAPCARWKRLKNC